MPDVWEMPNSISPSRLKLWYQCPLKFRVETIQKLRGGTNAAAVAGTTIHLALEWFMQLDGPERTRERLDPLIEAALVEMRESDDYKSLTDEQLKGFDAKVRRIAPRLLEMMDVQQVKVVSTEMRMEVDLEGWILRGIIDLLLAGANDALYVWDHKSGKAPDPRFQEKEMLGVHFYALMIFLEMGVIPAKIALGFLDKKVKLAATPTPRSIDVFRSRVLLARDQIAAACETGNFVTKTSALCDWCDLRPVCPAHGGSEDDIAALVALRS